MIFLHFMLDFIHEKYIFHLFRKEIRSNHVHLKHGIPVLPFLVEKLDHGVAWATLYFNNIVLQQVYSQSMFIVLVFIQHSDLSDDHISEK